MKKILWWLNILAALCLGLAYLATLVPPTIISWIPLFGLTYPVWVTLQIIFLTYWLVIKKRKKALLPFFILLIGWNIHANFFQLNGNGDSLDDNLKVLTYNVKLFDYYQWLEGKDTKNKIYQFIEDENADIMCFQEYYYENEGEFQTTEAIMKFSNTPYFQKKFTHKLSKNQFFGIITFSRYPIINQGEIPFSSDDNNFCIYSDILKNQDTIRVYNTHLSSIRFQKEDYDYLGNKNEKKDNLKNTQRIASRLINAYKKREMQSTKVLKSIEESPYPVILCGDFNDTPVSNCYARFNGVLKDSFQEKGNGISRTYIGNFPSFRIDYIFHSSELICKDYEVKDIHYSDHKPVVVEFEQ